MLRKLTDKLKRPSEEDPFVSLEAAYHSHLQHLAGLTQSITRLQESVSRLERHSTEVDQHIDQCDHDARCALQKGDEDTARKILERKYAHRHYSRQLQDSLGLVQQQLQELATQEQQLRAQIERLRSRKAVLQAQYTSARVQAQLMD